MDWWTGELSPCGPSGLFEILLGIDDKVTAFHTEFEPFPTGILEATCGAKCQDMVLAARSIVSCP